jgi:phosphoribosylglycinamide formyltransferase-1
MSDLQVRFRVGVLASGRGSNFQSIIDAVERGKLPVVIAIVLVNKKDAQALERARRHNIPGEFLDPDGFSDRVSYDRALAQRLQAYRVDLVVLAGYMRLVTPALIEPFKNRIINIHPSLLPSFPGLKAQRQALEHGVKVSGCTIHFVDEQMDHGPILLQASVPVEEWDTEESLSERILLEEHRLLPEAIALLAEGKVQVEGRRVIIEGREKS